MASPSATFIEVNKEEEKHKSSHLTVLKGLFYGPEKSSTTHSPPDIWRRVVVAYTHLVLVVLDRQQSQKRKELGARLLRRLYVTRLSLLDKDVKRVLLVTGYRVSQLSWTSSHRNELTRFF